MTYYTPKHSTWYEVQIKQDAYTLQWSSRHIGLDYEFARLYFQNTAIEYTQLDCRLCKVGPPPSHVVREVLAFHTGVQP